MRKQSRLENAENNYFIRRDVKSILPLGLCSSELGDKRFVDAVVDSSIFKLCLSLACFASDNFLQFRK